MSATIEIVTHALNVRSGPSTSYGADSVVTNGQQAVVDSFAYGQWLHMTTPHVGYVYAGSQTAPNVRLLDVSIPAPDGAAKVKTTAQLRVRNGPGTNYDVLFLLNQGQVIAIDPTKTVNGWYHIAGTGAQWISAQYTTPVDGPIPAPVPTPAPIPPSPPASGFSLPFNPAQYGGHMNPGGWVPGDAELEVFRGNHIGYALIPAYALNQQASIARLRSVGVQHFIIRPAITGGRGAAEFAQITLPILEQYAVALGSSNNMLIQLGNEPNLVEEGWTKYWQAGSDFAIWWLNVAGVYRANLPGCKIGFAPMSPGGNVPGQRMDELQFLSGCSAAIKSADFAVVHNYWARPDGSDLEVPLSQWRRSFGNLPLVIGESGPPLISPAVTREAVQHSHIMYIQAGIPAIYYIMDSSNDARFNNAGWLQQGIAV